MVRLEINKPVIGKRTGLGQAFDLFLSATHLPINEWANRNKK